MKLKIQNEKLKIAVIIQRLFAFLIFNFALTNFVFAQNDLQKIPDGGFIQKWLISNEFPAEIDAGMWENFNRFNIETLPQKDWLKPFGKPIAGTQKANSDSQNPQSQIPNPKSTDALPEVAAASTTKVFPNAKEITWTEFIEKDAVIAFHLFHEGKPAGTAYAASYINSAGDETKFIETDGFLGTIWLNDEKIYDGYSLTLKKVAVAKFKKGENLLLVRVTGVSGDYWRKDAGWSALIRLWNDKLSAENSARYKSVDQPGTVFYLEGFHVDPVYLQDQRGYSKVTLSNMNQYVSSLKADKNYGVFFSEIDYLKPYLDTHPEDRDFLRQTVMQGRVGTGGAYNQFNENTIGGEAIIRNILYGQEIHRAMLGRKSESLALWDVFGHAPQISQIAQKSGFSGIVWSKKITGFQPFFYDFALDGSKLLHRRLDYAYSFSGFGSGKNYSFENFLRMTERKFQEPRSFGSSVDLRINAADFTPPWTNLAGNVEKLNQNKPQIKTTGQAQDLYFQALNQEIADGKVKPPITSRDKLFFHVGVNMARSDLKIGQRLAENATLTAEKFGSIAYLLGAKYPDLALDKAWRQIFFGSHHDAITGTPSDSAFLDLVLGYREAIELSKGALNDSLRFIAKQIKTNAKFKIQNSKLIPIVVFNPMNWRRSDEVFIKLKDVNVNEYETRLLDANGKPVQFFYDVPNIYEQDLGEPIRFTAPNVPSLGYQTYFLEQKSKKLDTPLDIGCNDDRNQVIENEFYKITVDANKGGAISSIYDKQAKREIINTAKGSLGNEIAVLKEELTRKNVIYPAWEMWTTGEKTFSTKDFATVERHRTSSSQRLEIIGSLPNMKQFRQMITLRNGIKRIDFKTELVDYTGFNELFTVNFPLNLTGGALVTEDRFGTVVRNGSKGFLDFRTDTDRLVSGAPVYSVNNWAEYGTVLNLNFVSAAVDRSVPPAFAGERAKIIASVPFKPSALVRPKGEAFEKATETLVANFIKRGVSITPFDDDFEVERRRNLAIEDSTMPKKLNDDIAYHNFRIALGGENENTYTKELFKLISAQIRNKFADRLAQNGFAYLFLYDKNVPAGWPAMPVLIIVGDVERAVENLVAPIAKGEFALNIPAESFAVETLGAQTDGAQAPSPAMSATREKADNNSTSQSPNSSTLPAQRLQAGRLRSDAPSNLPKVPDYGVALINNGTAGVSLENPNTMTLHLTHTAIFPGVNLPFEFVPENKTHIFTYSLYPHEKDWREAETVKVGYDFNNPLIAVQTDLHDGNLPSEKSFLTNDYDKYGNVVLTAFKLGENPQANFQTKQLENIRSFILRFNETEGRNKTPNYFTFSPRQPSKDDYQFYDVFWRLTPADLLENERKDVQSQRNTNMAQAQFRQVIDGFSIDSYSLKIDGQIQRADSKNRESIGVEKEPVQPVFSRYWMHNMGAAPLGNDAVKVSLRPVEQMGNLSTFAWEDPYNQGGITTNVVRVQIVNNYQDRKISGEVTLEVPEDWRVVPEKITYEIEPNGTFTKDVAIIAFPVKNDLEFERASGLVKARIEHDGQIFQDVLNIGKPYKLEWRTEQTGEVVTIYIKNPYRQTIEGAVALITPPETWASGIYSTEPTYPRELGFSVPSNSEIALQFAHGVLPAGSWRIARIAYNGNVEYKRADGKTR